MRRRREQPGAHRGSGRTTDFAPIAVVETELTGLLAPIPERDGGGRAFGGARVLVRLHSKPLGIVEMSAADGGCTPSACLRAIWQQLGERINQHLRADGLPAVDGLHPGGLPRDPSPVCQERRRAVLANPPSVTVAVCTRNRPDVLGRALSAIEKLDYPTYETLVIDGSSASESEDLVRSGFPQVRYVRLGGGRLVVGRNRALALACGEVIAYTDDDGVVDRHWLTEHVAGFDHDQVACTTGFAAPLELATEAQLWFEELSVFGEGFDRRVVDLASRDRTSLLPYATGKIGAGVSMAWRTSALRGLGGFDPALDGCPGEDLAAFFDALCAGYQIVYDPAALVFHEHRQEYDALLRQLRSYATGLGAYLTRCVVTDPRRLLDFARRVPRGMIYAFGSSSVRNTHKSADFPVELTRVQLPGLAAGPWAYVSGRRHARRLPRYDGPSR